QYPPCDSTAGDDARYTLCRESAPIPWEELPAACHSATEATPRPAYEDTSGFPLELTFVEAGSRKERIPATNRPQQYFWRLPSQPDLTPAKNFDKAQNLDRLLRE